MGRPASIYRSLLQKSECPGILCQTFVITFRRRHDTRNITVINEISDFHCLANPVSRGPEHKVFIALSFDLRHRAQGGYVFVGNHDRAMSSTVTTSANDQAMPNNA